VVEGFYTDAKEYQRRVGLNISNRWQGQGATSAYQKSLWNARYSDPNGWSGAQIAAPTHASDSITGKDGRQWIVADQYDVEALWVYSNSQNRVIDTTSKNYNVELKYDNGGAFTGSLRAINATATNAQLFGTAQGGINSFRGNTVQKLTNNFYPKSYVENYNLTLDPARLGEVGTLGGRFVLPNPKGYDQDPNLNLTYKNYVSRWSGFDRPIAGNLTDANGQKSLADYMANKDSWIMEGEQLEIDNDNSSNLKAFSANGEYKFDDNFITSVEIGLRASSRSVDVENFAYWAQFYVGSPNRLTSPSFPNANNVVGCYSQWRSIDQKFDGGGGGAECSAGEYIAGHEGDAAYFTPYWVLPPQSLDHNGEKLQFVTDLGDNVKGIPGFWAVDPHTFDDPLKFNQKAFGDNKRIIDPGNSYTITLDEFSSYAVGNFKAGIVSGNLGVRVVQSDITADTYISTGIQRTNGAPNYYTGRETRTKSYTYVLPSLNMSFEATDNLKFRLAAAKNKQELDLDRYGSSLTVFTGPDPDDASQRIPSGWNSNGNINLKPWVTKNYDVSAEYYFGEASMLNIGAYLVKIDTFVENKGGQVITVTSKGKPYTITGSGPVEGVGGEVKGLELGAKLALSDFVSAGSFLTSFGIEANYTYSPSERPGLSSDVSGEKYPFANNSKNTYNLAFWYQKDKLQARIALNGRSDRYITDFGTNGFAEYEPGATYLDANVSYDVLDNVTVYIQGSNLTSTDYKQVYRLADGVEQNAFIYDNEARYSLGVRAKF
jgi:TonB-dependent receptor